MRRKVFDLLFEPQQKMTELTTVSSLWRSLFYFVLSMGIYLGVIINVALAETTLAVRGGIISGSMVALLTALIVYGCFLHGLSDACGSPGGDIIALFNLLGYAALPYLVATPFALLAVKFGGGFLLILLLAGFIAFLWSLYLIMRAVQAVYLLTFLKACLIVGFSILLLATIIIWPIYLISKLMMLAFA